jgi:hypothetical protein
MWIQKKLISSLETTITRHDQRYGAFSLDSKSAIRAALIGQIARQEMRMVRD